MKKITLITIFLLSGILVLAQSSSKRIEVANNMEILMRVQGFDIKFKTMGEGNYMLQIDQAELTTVLEVYTFIIASTKEVWEMLCKSDIGFIYICFKQIDKCYTIKEIRHFFTL